MALYRITIKRSGVYNGIRLEKGMAVEVPALINPLYENNGQEINNAFIRIYGIDLKKAGLLSSFAFDIEKK